MDVLLRNDGPYLRLLRELKHRIDGGHVRADCERCRLIHEAAPGNEDFLLCPACACCSMVTEDEGAPLCPGGCSEGAMHD